MCMSNAREVSLRILLLITCEMGVIAASMVMLLTIVWTKEECRPYINETEACPIEINELDFLHLKLHNSSDVKFFRDIQRHWPCAFRQFWAQGWFHNYVETVRFLYKFILPLEIVIGVPVNIFALRKIKAKQEQFVRTRYRQSTVYTFSKYQCWCDIGVLAITCAMGYARSYVPVFDNLFMSSISSCRFYKVLATFFQFSSPWLNVVIAFNRLSDVKWPDRSQFRMTSKKLHLIMAVLFISAFAIASTKFYYSDFEQYPSFEYDGCEERGHTNVPLVLFYIALATWLPSIFLIAVNVCLTVVIIRRVSFNNMDNWKDQKRKIIQVIWIVSIVYAFVQIPLGVVESFELYWNLQKIQNICKSDRDAFVQWLTTKMSLKWFRALLYLCYQIPFIINFSCLLLTRDDFRFCKRSLFRFCKATSGVQQTVSQSRSSASLSEHMELPLLSHNSPDASYISRCRLRMVKTTAKKSSNREISRISIRRQSI